MTEGVRRPLRLALTLPGTIWLAAFLAIPGLLLFGLAFLSRGAHGEIVWRLTFDNFARLLGFGSFGWTADYLRILVRSVVVAGVTTLVALGLAYPVAFFIASRAPRRRSFWLALVLIPFATNLVIRTYGWMLIFAPALPPARLARWLGLIDAQAGLFPGAFATYVGLISAALPFAVLPLYSNVERLDPALLEAARDLYAPGWRVFRRVIVPLTLPGLTTAAFLTFVPTLGMFVVPDLLGGARYWLIGNVIQQQFGASRDWPFGAALGLALVVLTLAAWWLVRKKGTAGSLA